MPKSGSRRPVEILMVDDNPADARLTELALKEDKVRSRLNVVRDGGQALAFLRREGPYAGAPQPDLIVLDLNLPGVSGHEVLAAVKSDPALRRIPVVVLTSSDAESDVAKSYDLHANCYIKKPVDLDALAAIVRVIDEFWFSVVRLPRE